MSVAVVYVKQYSISLISFNQFEFCDLTFIYFFFLLCLIDYHNGPKYTKNKKIRFGVSKVVLVFFLKDDPFSVTWKTFAKIAAHVWSRLAGSVDRQWLSWHTHTHTLTCRCKAKHSGCLLMLLKQVSQGFGSMANPKYPNPNYAKRLHGPDGSLTCSGSELESASWWPRGKIFLC